MKFFLLSIVMLFQNCELIQSSSPVSTADTGGDFRSRLIKGKDVLVEGQEISGDVDFTGYGISYLIAPGTNRVNINSSVTFNKCRFKGKVIAYKNEPGGKVTATSFTKNVTFTDCTFEEDVTFRGTNIQEQASFSGCIFLKKANFEELDCQSYAVFSNCQFSTDVRFQNAYFRKKADFMKTEFSQSVNFQGAYFMLDAQFGAVKCFKNADFSLVQFYGHAFFNYAEWNDQVTFEDAWLKGRAEFIHTKFVNASLKNAWFLGKPRFDQAIVDISIDLSGAHWMGGKPEWGSIDKGKMKE